jgi:hypothetical protein
MHLQLSDTQAAETEVTALLISKNRTQCVQMTCSQKRKICTSKVFGYTLCIPGDMTNIWMIWWSGWYSTSLHVFWKNDVGYISHSILYAGFQRWRLMSSFLIQEVRESPPSLSGLHMDQRKYIYMCVYIYVYIYVCVCVYIYIYRVWQKELPDLGGA